MILAFIYVAFVVVCGIAMVFGLSEACWSMLAMARKAPAYLWNLKKTAKARILLMVYATGSLLVGAVSSWSAILVPMADGAEDMELADGIRRFLGPWRQLPWQWWLILLEAGIMNVVGSLLVMAIGVGNNIERGRTSRLNVRAMFKGWTIQAIVVSALFLGGAAFVLKPAIKAGYSPESEDVAWIAAAIIPSGVLVAGAMATIARVGKWLVRRLNVGADLTDAVEPLPGVPEVIRGRAFWPLHAMRAELERFLKNDGVSYGEVRVQFGGLAIPEKLLGPHAVFCGATGAGKTISMQLFLGTAVFLRRKLRHRVVTHDVKGDQCAFFRHNGVAGSDLVLCDPGSSRGWAWDIAADVRDPEGARQLAAMFCPTEKGGQPYFSQVAQELAAEVLQVLQKVAPRAWTLRDVVLVCRSRELLKEILDATESGRMAWRNHVENNAPSTAGSVLSTLASKLGSLSYTAGRWNEAKARFSLRAFLRADPKVLVLRNRANRSEVSTPVFRALLRFMAEDVLAMPENHDFGKTWFVLDEVPSLGVFEKLDTFLSQARSKGGHVLLGFQDIDAMASVWGRERANALIGLCTNVTCLQTSSPTTAAYWTKAFGSYKFPEVSVTESYGHKNSGSSRTTANKTEAAILESEIMDLPPASARRGIVGCYMTPMVGMWRGETSPEVLRPLLPDLTKNTDDELEDAEVELLPWNDEDRARLGLQLRMQPDEDRPRGIPDKDGGLEAAE
jgi:hypothetical protein